MRLHRLVLICLLVLSAGRCTAFSTQDVTRAVERLGGTPYVLVGSAGESAGGRDIPFMVVVEPHGDPQKKLRVLIIAGQHGNEATAVMGTLSLAKRLATGQDETVQTLRDEGIFIFVPLVNPDGAAASKRTNGAGADLNRDWKRRRQPETQAVVSLARTWKPDIVLDVHEWLDGDPGIQRFVETSDFTASCIRDAALSRDGLESFRGVTSSPDASSALAHRYFSSSGIPSFLIETDRLSDTEKQLALYREACLSIMHAAVSNRRFLVSRPWQVPAVLREFTAPPQAVKQPSQPPNKNMHVFILLLSYVLLVGVLRLRKTGTTDARREIIRLSPAIPRREHDLAYWMTHPRLSTRGLLRRH